MTSINEYFSGEKLQCSIGIAIGAISIVLALYFLLHIKTELFKGIAWPLLLISALLLTICISVVLRTPRDIERVSRFVNNAPEKIQTEEIPRMEKVMTSFKIIKAVEIVLLIAGGIMILVGFSKGYPFITGIGAGLAIQSALMFGFDYFAHERAKEYFEFLSGL